MDERNSFWLLTMFLRSLRLNSSISPDLGRNRNGTTERSGEAGHSNPGSCRSLWCSHSASAIFSARFSRNAGQARRFHHAMVGLIRGINGPNAQVVAKKMFARRDDGAEIGQGPAARENAARGTARFLKLANELTSLDFQR